MALDEESDFCCHLKAHFTISCRVTMIRKVNSEMKPL